MKVAASQSTNWCILVHRSCSTFLFCRYFPPSRLNYQLSFFLVAVGRKSTGLIVCWACVINTCLNYLHLVFIYVCNYMLWTCSSCFCVNIIPFLLLLLSLSVAFALPFFFSFTLILTWILNNYFYTMFNSLNAKI